MEGGMNLVEMWSQMGYVAKGIGYILFIMSFWSVGVAVERIYTYRKARAQSKLFAPQVAKHLKEGRLKDAIAVGNKKDYKYSHLAKVVGAGLQEYQFQTEGGGASLGREDLLDTVRRAIQRSSALTQNDMKRRSLIGHDWFYCSIRGSFGHSRWYYQRIRWYCGDGFWWYRCRLGRYCGSPR
jgi:hypothetical protein